LLAAKFGVKNFCYLRVFAGGTVITLRVPFALSLSKAGSTSSPPTANSRFFEIAERRDSLNLMTLTRAVVFAGARFYLKNSVV
jgi:hypothetical protein